MSLVELRLHFETFGADFARWPPELVEAALELIGRSEEAQDAFVKATALDLVLSDARGAGAGSADEGGA